MLLYLQTRLSVTVRSLSHAPVSSPPDIGPTLTTHWLTCLHSGDIENIISELVKAAGHSGLNLGNVLSGGGGLLGFAAGAVKAAASVAGGGKFTKDDVKKIYFVSLFRQVDPKLTLRV